jgi:hypothetical protein
MKPTRATLVSDPFQTAADDRWRAIAEIERHGRVYLIFQDEPKDLKRKDQVNARYEAGEWRVG